MKTQTPNSLITVPITLDNFFPVWVDFLTPFYNLTQNGKKVFAALLKKRYKLSKTAKPTDDLDSIMLSKAGKKELIEELQMNRLCFKIALDLLITEKIIVDGKINKRLIPKITNDKGIYKVMLVFNIS